MYEFELFLTRSYLHEEFVEEAPQPKRKTTDSVYPSKDKKTENAVKADSALEIEEEKSSSKFTVEKFYWNEKL